MQHITVEDAAKALGKSPQFIRVCLQKGLLPFGTACKMPRSNVYTYVIFPNKFREYVTHENNFSNCPDA